MFCEVPCGEVGEVGVEALGAGEACWSEGGEEGVEVWTEVGVCGRGWGEIVPCSFECGEDLGKGEEALG